MRIVPLLMFLLGAAHLTAFAAEPPLYEDQVVPVFSEHCVRCHGGKKTKGKIDLKALATTAEFLAQPALIQNVIEVVEASDMPPEDEAQPTKSERATLLKNLRTLRLQAVHASAAEPPRTPIRRLNRLQYNYAVRDLFELDRDLFHLPEKLMTRRTPYIRERAPDRPMPDRVDVLCQSLETRVGMAEVAAFPKDLRAAHGFDNQANQLSLSPLLLDSFLKLSLSVVQSPDFTSESVGIWDAFFAQPVEFNLYDAAPRRAAVRERLAPFLRRAFRAPVDDETVDRYTDFVLAKLAAKQGGQGGDENTDAEAMPFPQAMKKAASAALASPRFLYRSQSEEEEAFAFASRLSFFLWGSGPDEDLLDLAASGELLKPEVLEASFERMVADPKIERFLDTFPGQWMQLENVLAATPDPKTHRLFSLEKSRPASAQMILEPLLLFDAVFLENRPLRDLLRPGFHYRSDFLHDWFTTDLEAPPVDEASIKKENEARERVLRDFDGKIGAARKVRDELDLDIKQPIGRVSDIDLAPGQARWETQQLALVSNMVVLSDWHMIGPFAGGNFDMAHDKSFFDESKIDIEAETGGKRWQHRPAFVDGKVHGLNGDSAATYLTRTITSEAARPVEISLGTDDSFKIWLNGVIVAQKKITRGVAPDQDKLTLQLLAGENRVLLKVVNGGGGYGFYFKARQLPLPAPVIAALKVDASERNAGQREAIAAHYLAIAPELADLRKQLAGKRSEADRRLKDLEAQRQRAPKPKSLADHRRDRQRDFDNQLRNKIRANTFVRRPSDDPRYGGIITSGAMLSMTATPKRTMPVARGAWMIEVVLNDPPPPPPNDVPPLDEDSDEDLTIREKFAKHREHPDCAGCHERLDPLGFALENFDLTGRWRDSYENGRDVDAAGTLLRKHDFEDIVQFRAGLVAEEDRFATAFVKHLLRFATARELTPADLLAAEQIAAAAAGDEFRLRSLLRGVVMNPRFSGVSAK